MKFNNMNISIYTTSDFPHGGAAENFVREMALGLNKCVKGIEIIRLRGSMYPYSNNTEIKCSDLLFKKRRKNEFFKALELILIVFVTPLSVIYHKIKFKTNIIILYGIEYAYFTVPFLVVSKLLKIKIFRIITDHYKTKDFAPVWWKRPKAYFYQQQFRTIDKMFSGIIVLSSYLREIVLETGVSELKVLLIPHFINLNSFSSSEFLYKKEDSIKIIGFCGTPSISNGILELIDAFKIIKLKHDDIRLLVIGKLNKEIGELINEKFEESLLNHVSFTGFKKKEDIVKLLNSCDILVNPRKSGLLADAGFPTKLGEYFAVKKPVVTTKVGDLVTYFKNKEELIFAEPDDSQSLASSMLFLIENETEAQCIAINGYKWAMKNLDYIENSKTLLHFIKN